MWSPALPRRAPRCTDCRTSTVIAVAAVIGQPVNQHPTVTDRTIRREVVRGHEPSLGLDDCEGSTGLVRGDSPMSAMALKRYAISISGRTACGGKADVFAQSREPAIDSNASSGRASQEVISSWGENGPWRSL